MLLIVADTNAATAFRAGQRWSFGAHGDTSGTGYFGDVVYLFHFSCSLYPIIPTEANTLRDVV
jgi:hypothetical protein